MTTHTTPTCDRCAKPVADGSYVCRTCTAPVRDRLAAVVALAAEVETTVARLSRHAERGGRRVLPVDDDGQRTGGGLRVTPLPVNLAAKDRANVASNVIVTWARHVAEERGGGPLRPEAAIGPLCRSGAGCRHGSCALIRARSVPHPVARAAAWLAEQLDWLRHRREAVEALPELDAACRDLVRLVDAPPPLWYAGPCWASTFAGEQCEEPLYAHAGASTVRCPAPGCRTQHDVAARRRWLLDEADRVLAHATLIAAALTVLDRPVTSSMVRNYAARRWIEARGVDREGRPLYRVGDVRKAVTEHARRTVAVAA